ncbi:MAG: tripartite tricarboxylate transporter substrate-binding protein [Burkholderiaceae bacterium]
MKLWQKLGSTLFGAALAATSMTAQAADPITIMVGFPPGGATDTVGRLLAEKLQDILGEPVIVENKPGIGGRIAAQALAKAPTDGRTYMIAPNATGVFQQIHYPESVLKYDLLRDLKAIGMITSYPMGMVASAEAGVSNLKEYAAWLKKNPDKANIGVAGLGGDTHFNSMQFAKLAGVDLTVVPYRGNGPLVTELLGNQIPAGTMVIGDAIQHIRAGKMVALAVIDDKRSPLLPDVPTTVEQGFDTGGGPGWMGLWAPAGSPDGANQRLAAALEKALAMPDVRKTLTERAMQPDFRSGQAMTEQVKKELAHWGPVVKASGFKPSR